MKATVFHYEEIDLSQIDVLLIEESRRHNETEYSELFFIDMQKFVNMFKDKEGYEKKNKDKEEFFSFYEGLSYTLEILEQIFKHLKKGNETGFFETSNKYSLSDTKYEYEVFKHKDVNNMDGLQGKSFLKYHIEVH